MSAASDDFPVAGLLHASQIQRLLIDNIKESDNEIERETHGSGFVHHSLHDRGYERILDNEILEKLWAERERWQRTNLTLEISSGVRAPRISCLLANTSNDAPDSLC